MNEEEKKAIEKLNSIIKVNNDFLSCVNNQTINQEEIKSIQIALNMIESFLWKEEQQKELLKYKTDRIQKQEKEIDKLKKSIAKASIIIDEYANEIENDTKKITEYRKRHLDN